MKFSSKKRILSLVLAVFCTVFMIIPATAADYQQKSSSTLRNSFNAAGAAIIGGGTEPVEIRVFPNGSFGVFINEYTPNYQYYNEYAYGSIWFVGGNQYSTEYLKAGNTSAGSNPTAEGSLGMGQLSVNGRTATVTWDKDGMIFSTSYTLAANSRTVVQSWDFTNNTGAPISGARLIAGGDTYFAGSDHGYATWDNNAGISVFRDENSGLMNFLPSTPADGYYSAFWSTGKDGAQSGQLPNTVHEDYTDQSYYLQWDYDVVEPGETRTIHAQQSFAEAGGFMGTPPSLGQSGLPGGTMSFNFQLTNATGVPVTVGLEADGGEHDVSFTNPNSGSMDMRASVAYGNTVTIPARSSINVEVFLTVSQSAAPGAHTLTLTATDTVTGTAVTIPATFNVNARGVYMTAPARQTVQYGSAADISYVFNVFNNMETTSADVSFNVTSSSGYNVSLDTTQLTLAAGASNNIQATVSIPNTAPAGSTDTLTVSATYTNDQNQQKTSTATVLTTVSGGNQGPVYYDSDSSSSSGGSGGVVDSAPALTWLEKARAVSLVGKDSAQGFIRTRGTGTYGARLAALKALTGLRYEHDTISGSMVQVRIAIAKPGQMAKDTMVSGYVKGAEVDRMQSRFEKWFSNKIRIIHLDQKDDWGQPVTISAKVDLSGMNTGNLFFYSYNKSDNSYRFIANPSYKVDANGYLTFTTPYAGDIIVSDGLLALK